MSRFLFIAEDYKPNPGGIAAYLDGLARGLIRQGLETKVLALVDPDDAQRMSFLRTYENWVVPFPIVFDPRPRSFLKSRLVSFLEILRCLSPLCRRYLDRTPYFRRSSETMVQLGRILARETPTAVVFGHVYVRFYNFVFPLLERRVPYGVIAHDSEIYKAPARVNDVVRRGMLLKNASWIAANSRHTKSLLEAWGISDAKIMIVHPPLAGEAMRESSMSKRAPHETRFTIVTVCRLVRAKGVDIVLEALHLLAQQSIPFRYVVAGAGPEQQSLEQLARELGVCEYTEFAGYISEADKWSLLASADVFVMTSRVNPGEQHEGFGIAFIEAGAFGIPTVGTRAGGIPEAIVDGETGILVDPESPPKLAEALACLYHHPERRRVMGEAGKVRALAHFSPMAVAARFYEEASRRI